MSERTDKLLKELGYEPAKTKKPQPETPNNVQNRDRFQTPNYAVDLLINFVPGHIKWVWEPACGDGMIVKRLLEASNLDVYASDLKKSDSFSHEVKNFFDYNKLPEFEGLTAENTCIITNPPFSLKLFFYKKCVEFGVPFALLIPADYSGWTIRAVSEHGAEKIVPTRRIDFITPSGKSGATGHGSDFHSLWLTWGFGLGKTETFVELSNEEKKNNIFSEKGLGE